MVADLKRSGRQQRGWSAGDFHPSLHWPGRRDSSARALYFYL